MAIDVDRLVGLIEDAAIRYAGGCPVDFRPTAKEIAALVLEEAAKVCEGVVSNDPNCVWEAAYKHVADEHAAAIRNLAKGVE